MLHVMLEEAIVRNIHSAYFVIAVVIFLELLHG